MCSYQAVPHNPTPTFAKFTKTSIHTRHPEAILLDDANLVGNVEGVVVGGESHVRLLGAVRPDEGVDLRALNVVHALDGVLDLLLVRPVAPRVEGEENGQHR